ncbi:hypothetical protein HYV74_05215 [Candidatus Uhrbacteria bacterium]|nr:hypothetical protein [Candidatus Uhrbacteria bacterium]
MTDIETPYDSFRKVLTHPILQGMVLVALALGLATWMELPNHFPDPDSFYHAGMAELAATGTFPQQFPWLQLTTLRTAYADLHFLYHLLLVPFVRLFGAMPGVRIATILSVGLLTLTMFGLLRTLRVRGAFGCIALLLGSAPFFFRMNLAKAQGFAVALLALGLIAVVRRSRTGTFLAAVFAVWLSSHWPVLAMTAIAICGIDIVLALLIHRDRAHLVPALRTNASLIGSTIFGVMAAAIVHPYFPQNLNVARQQMMDIAFIAGPTTANVGAEWQPLTGVQLVDHTGFLLLLGGIASIGIVLLVLRAMTTADPERRHAAAIALGCGSMAIAFGVFAMRQQRQLEFFVPLLILTIATGLQPIIAWLWPARVVIGWRSPGTIRRPLATAALLTIMVAYSIGSIPALRMHRTYFTNGYPGNHLRSAAQWMRANIPAGAIVFHGNWSDFPFLFLWNREHRYLIGLDPRFAEFADASQFQRWQSIARGDVRAPAASIRSTFDATHALVTSSQTALRSALDADRRARLVYTDADARVYELSPNIEERPRPDRAAAPALLQKTKPLPRRNAR